MLLQVTIAIADPRLRGQLETIAAGPDTHVEIIKQPRYFWKKIRSRTSDVIIVSREFIPSPISGEIKSLQDLPGIPSIVVITETETPQERAQYVAAGFDVLLESRVGVDVLKKAIGAILAKRSKLAKKLIATERKAAEPLLNSFVDNSKVMKKFMKMARRAAKTDSVVLILGETGVGKERLAHTIHNESLRRENPFIAITNQYMV